MEGKHLQDLDGHALKLWRDRVSRVHAAPYAGSNFLSLCPALFCARWEGAGFLLALCTFLAISLAALKRKPTFDGKLRSCSCSCARLAHVLAFRFATYVVSPSLAWQGGLPVVTKPETFCSLGLSS